MTFSKLHLIVLIIACAKTAYSQTSRAAFLSTMLNNYSRVQPQFDSNKPVYINVAVAVLDFDSVNEETMDYSMTMVVHLRWHDKRLNYTQQLNMSFLELDVKMIENIWVPDLYVVNGKTSRFHNVPSPNKMMHIFPDGTVIYKLRTNVHGNSDGKYHRGITPSYIIINMLCLSV